MNKKFARLGLTILLVLAVTLSFAGIALAFESGDNPGSVGPNTIEWTGQGAHDGSGVLDTTICPTKDTVPDGIDPYNYLHWIFTTDGGAVQEVPAPQLTLTLDGVVVGTFDGQFMTNSENGGGAWHIFTPYYTPDKAHLAASVAFDVVDPGNGAWNLTISHGCGGKANPKIVTVQNPAEVMLGTDPVVLNDSAILSDGNNPTGTITFQLYDPNNNIVYTEDVAVNGNGTYYTSGYTLPTMDTVTGTYQWVASYSGDMYNNPAASCNGDEPVVVKPANPSIVTVQNPAEVILGTVPVTLKDSATLSGGYYPTGTITFELYSPANIVVDTETVAVNGNGTYSTPVGYTLPTSGSVTGTYQWVASYSGDGNNNPAVSGYGDEPVVVKPANPRIVTTPKPSVGILGTVLNDSAVLSDGYYPTGTITFNLFPPRDATCAGSPAFTNVISVNGNGSYLTSTGFAANAYGVWHWMATYSGDANNNPAYSKCEDEAVTIYKAALTPGYWKTHLTYDKRNPVNPYTASYLPLKLGNFTVTNTSIATAIWNAMNCSSTKAQDAVGCLAGHLLAAKLNIANGANPCIVNTIQKADAFLISINYTGPLGKYTLTVAQRATAISLKTAVDQYNNNTANACK